MLILIRLCQEKVSWSCKARKVTGFAGGFNQHEVMCSMLLVSAT